MSITGDFGASAKKSAMEMLKKNLVHTIASDAHSLNKRPPILSRAVKTAEKIISPKFVQAMVVDTPLKIINTI